jgi:hypothetical protein
MKPYRRETAGLFYRLQLDGGVQLRSATFRFLDVSQAASQYFSHLSFFATHCRSAARALRQARS